MGGWIKYIYIHLFFIYFLVCVCVGVGGGGGGGLFAWVFGNVCRAGAWVSRLSPHPPQLIKNTRWWLNLPLPPPPTFFRPRRLPSPPSGCTGPGCLCFSIRCWGFLVGFCCFCWFNVLLAVWICVVVCSGVCVCVCAYVCVSVKLCLSFLLYVWFMSHKTNID